MSKLSDGIKTATETAKEGIATAKATTAKGSAAAREQAAKAYEAGREAAARGVNTSKKIAHKAVDKTTAGFDKNPLAIVLGGLAIGAIAGALIPQLKGEEKVLGKTGKKLNKKAKKVAEAAKAAGKDKVDSLGLGSDAIREQFRNLVGKAAEAVKAAGQAANDAARKND
jgi:ElaB/YqjD/DUF883 family membrane-anchored ribosome-binding protein